MPGSCGPGSLVQPTSSAELVPSHRVHQETLSLASLPPAPRKFSRKLRDWGGNYATGECQQTYVYEHPAPSDDGALEAHCIIAMKRSLGFYGCITNVCCFRRRLAKAKVLPWSPVGPSVKAEIAASMMSGEGLLPHSAWCCGPLQEICNPFRPSLARPPSRAIRPVTAGSCLGPASRHSAGAGLCSACSAAPFKEGSSKSRRWLANQL